MRESRVLLDLRFNRLPRFALGIAQLPQQRRQAVVREVFGAHRLAQRSLSGRSVRHRPRLHMVEPMIPAQRDRT